MTTRYDSAPVRERIRALLDTDKPEALAELIIELHPADRAELYEELEPTDQAAFLAVLGAPELASLLESLDQESRGEAVQHIAQPLLPGVLDEMTADDAADVLQSLPQQAAQQILAGMKTALSVAPLLAYASDSAGGLMTPRYTGLRPDMTAQDAINHMRALHPGAEQAYYLYVLTDERRLLGVVNLRELIVADPSTRITNLMTREVISVPAGADQEECARVLQKYRLLALPVIDEGGVLRGIITADDVLDVLAEEATEDMYKMAGVGVQERALSPLPESLRRRMPHLVINLLTAFLSGLTVSAFDSTISKAASLAVFMPIVAGHGGNTGTQVSTIVVRSVALGELKTKDTITILLKEIGFGLIHGTLVGTVTAGFALALYHNPWLAGVVLGAMVGNVVVAGIVGCLIPLGLSALKMDPALASSIWLTTFTDIIGFLMLLGAGTLLVTHVA